MAVHSQRRLHLFLIPLLCLSAVARAQSGGSVRMSGGVSETVALSLTPSSDSPGVRVTSSRNTDRSLAVTISGSTRGRTQVSVPVQIRSNAGYRLLAAARAGGASLSSLLVVGAHPTGILVAPRAAETINVAAVFDGRNEAGRLIHADGSNRQGLSSLVEILSGPRVSTGGLPGSPQNALEVTLSVVVEPRAAYQVWSIELLLSAEPGAGF